MRSEMIFPTVLIALDIAVAVLYGIGDTDCVRDIQMKGKA